jgi:isocitrate dehydrogenase
MTAATELTIEFIDRDGNATALRSPVAVQAGEVVDTTAMSKAALVDFLTAEIDDARAKGVLFSLHLKATMMKVSDPIIFGHGVRAYFADVFAKHGDTLTAAGANPNNGLGNVLDAVESLPSDVKAAIEADIAATYASGPDVAMVDSDNGITNLHVPSDVIIDASMPAMIRTSGQMWNTAGDLQDTKTVIPDSSYAGVYDETIKFCQEHGAFDPTTMGTVPNVGLMAQKAEEYGSHDKTFEMAEPGAVRVTDTAGNVVFEHKVGEGDIWRMCQVKDAPVQDWVKLAATRGRLSATPVVFWLDEARAHDAHLIAKVKQYLPDHEIEGVQIEIMSPVEATRFSLERIARGEDTISATGNVLRDYLTDLFPILELGTSAKMLSIVPLMKGGGLFETGAGGSAPKHVQQFEKENHLRWDSLGEFLALAVSLEHLAQNFGNAGAQIMADALDAATGRFLDEGRSPSRKVNELDNRGSHFYLAMYWAEALATQSEDPAFAARFAPLAAALADNEQAIVAELNAVQGQAMDIGGYYFPDPEQAAAAMQPSSTLNAALADFVAG